MSTPGPPRCTSSRPDAHLHCVAADTREGPAIAAKRADEPDSDIGRRRSAAQRDGGVAYKQRRDEVIRAAAQVFKDKGYRAAGLGDIAALLNTDRASLYYYVSGKRELYEEVVGDALRRNVLEAERIRKSDFTPSEKLRELIADLMDAYDRHYPYLYVYVQEDLTRSTPDASPQSRELKRLGKRYDAAVVGVVEEGVADGSFKLSATPTVIAYGIIGMLNWSHRWFKPAGAMSGRELGEALADMVLGGLAIAND